jgi:hypothetical protein
MPPAPLCDSVPLPPNKVEKTRLLPAGPISLTIVSFPYPLASALVGPVVSVTGKSVAVVVPVIATSPEPSTAINPPLCTPPAPMNVK